MTQHTAESAPVQRQLRALQKEAAMSTWLSDPRGMWLACKDEAVHRLAVQVRNADVDRAGAIGCLLDAGASSRSEASYLTSQGTKRPLYFCKASAYCALPGACTCYIHGRLVHQYPRSRKPDTDTIPRAAQRWRQAQCGCARGGEKASPCRYEKSRSTSLLSQRYLCSLGLDGRPPALE